MLSVESVMSSPTHRASLGWYVISSGVSQQSDAGLWKTTLVSGSTAYWKILQGCQRGHSSVLGPRAQWKLVRTSLMRRAAASPSLFLPFCLRTQTRAATPIPSRSEVRMEGLLLTVGVVRKGREMRISSGGGGFKSPTLERSVTHPEWGDYLGRTWRHIPVAPSWKSTSKVMT